MTNERNDKDRYSALFVSQPPMQGRKILEDGSFINEADLLDRIDQGMSSFNELMVVEPRTQIDLKSVYPLSKLNDKITATLGSVTQADGQYRVEVTADGTAEVLFRSVRRGLYVAGLDGVTGIGIRIPTRPTGNQVIEWGATDFQNGYVVGEDAAGMFTALYRNGVMVEQHRREDWNDPLTNTLNPQQLNVYRLFVRWYGRGPYKLSLATESANGEGRVSRADTTTLVDDGPITFDPNQPISVRIRNNGTAAPLEAFVCGRQFTVFGQTTKQPRSVSAFRLAQTVGLTFEPVISFRQKIGDYLSISTALQSVKLIASSASVIWEVRVFGALTGAVWGDPDNKESGVETAMEVDTSATAITGGIQLYQGLQASGQGVAPGGSPLDLPDKELPGEGVIITLCARSVSGTATLTSVFTISEFW